MVLSKVVTTTWLTKQSACLGLPDTARRTSLVWTTSTSTFRKTRKHVDVLCDSHALTTSRSPFPMRRKRIALDHLPWNVDSVSGQSEGISSEHLNRCSRAGAPRQT